eukprot:scaffold2480_cov198-Chaetoceros_neogracile.AAC.2
MTRQVFRLAKARARSVDRAITSTLSATRVPAFLSQSEINNVLTLKEKHQILGFTPSKPRDHWQTQYVSAGGLFESSFPDIYAKIKALPPLVDRRLFGDSGGTKESQEQLHQDCLQDIHVRCAEIHTSRAGGSLNDPGHFDSGSVVTVDILLSGEFEGGAMTMSGEKIDFEVGDALIFPSYKYHTVEKITGGTRECLVMEFWNGEEKLCNHRCNIAKGNCQEFL